MGKFVLLAILGLSVQASADVIKCSFTEPFIQTTYSTDQKTLTIDTLGTQPQVISDVSLQTTGPQQFLLVAKDGRVIQKLALNYKGSDGMSDDVYPYDVQYSYKAGQTLYGGCESTQFRKTPHN
jgi:uncharacterized membrane protein